MKSRLNSVFLLVCNRCNEQSMTFLKDNYPVRKESTAEYKVTVKMTCSDMNQIWQTGHQTVVWWIVWLNLVKNDPNWFLFQTNCGQIFDRTLVRCLVYQNLLECQGTLHPWLNLNHEPLCLRSFSLFTSLGGTGVWEGELPLQSGRNMLFPPKLCAFRANVV